MASSRRTQNGGSGAAAGASSPVSLSLPPGVGSTNRCRTAHLFDAQVGYTVPKLHTTVQVGGTNLFEGTNFQVYGAPSEGRIVYAGLLFDID